MNFNEDINDTLINNEQEYQKDKIYRLIEKFSLFNFDGGRCYLKLLKGIKYRYELLVILKHSAKVELFADLQKIFCKYNILISYGTDPGKIFYGNDLIMVNDGKNIVYHEVTGSGILKHVTSQSYKFDNKLRNFNESCCCSSYLIGLKI